MNRQVTLESFNRSLFYILTLERGRRIRFQKNQSNLSEEGRNLLLYVLSTYLPLIQKENKPKNKQEH